MYYVIEKKVAFAISFPDEYPISVVVVFHFYSAAALLALGLGFGVKVRF